MGASLSRARPLVSARPRAIVGPDGTLVALGRVGLITFKDCKAVMTEALGIPADRTGHFWGMRESLALEDCDILRARGHADAAPGGRGPPSAG